MAGLDVWDGFFLAVGAYIAVMALVRLMRAHRKKVTEELYEQFQAEQIRKRAERAKAKSKAREDAA